MTHEIHGPEQDRAALLALIDRLAAAWSGDSPDAACWLSPEARLDSNLHGQLGGAQDIQNALAADGRQGACTIRTSNRYAAARGDEGVASLYAYGLLRNQGDATQALLFGATVVLRAARTEGGWRASHVRISSSWMRGSERLAAHWLLPPSDAGWQVGDPPPVLVSELHSPWALQPIGTPPSDLFDAISELYSRYSFAIDQGDILLHHPFESFSPVVNLLAEAARDPKVLAIKQTLYRTGADSNIVSSLVEAARQGKEITVVIELRARFDEADNLALASRLQEAGAIVIYGVMAYKTHAKMMHIVRREKGALRR